MTANQTTQAHTFDIQASPQQGNPTRLGKALFRGMPVTNMPQVPVLVDGIALC